VGSRLRRRARGSTRARPVRSRGTAVAGSGGAIGGRPRARPPSEAALARRPCLGLDPATRRLLLGELLAAAADEGCGILLSTHLLNEVAPALDRLLTLDGGRLVLDAPIEEIRARENGASLEDAFVALSATGGGR
jgi:ABC-2 type transport system ATP-binding protein